MSAHVQCLVWVSPWDAGGNPGSDESTLHSLLAWWESYVRDLRWEATTGILSLLYMSGIAFFFILYVRDLMEEARYQGPFSHSVCQWSDRETRH